MKQTKKEILGNTPNVKNSKVIGNNTVSIEYGNGNKAIRLHNIEGSVKAVIELFNLKTGRTWDDIRTSHIDDRILELKGVRLYKYLINNYYSDLFKPKYIKSLDGIRKGKQFVFEVNKNYKGEPYTMILSKNFVSNSCTLTGVCFDMDILQPVYDFLEKPDANTTFEDLTRDIESAISKCYRDEEEYVNTLQKLLRQTIMNLHKMGN